jgi:RNA polymerase sigma-70 factor (ECF subfamily)
VSNSKESIEDFESMMRANGPKIYTLAVRLAGNLSDGQDLAQETFVKAYEHWENFRGEAEVSTWLYRICVNQWKNRVRYEKRRAFWKHFSLDSQHEDDETPVREIPSGEPPAGQALEQAQQVETLHKALVRMKPEDRAVLVLYEMEERSYEDIAGLLNVPIGTVRSRLARSRDKLRQMLENDLKRSL